MSDNFYEMSAKMKELFPSNPEADKKALLAMAGNTSPVETPTVEFQLVLYYLQWPVIQHQLKLQQWYKRV